MIKSLCFVSVVLAAAVRADHYDFGVAPQAPIALSTSEVVTVIPSGWASFDGSVVVVRDQAGAALVTTTVFPSAVFPSFIALQPDNATLLLGESSNGGLWEFVLPAGPATLLATAAFNYDATFDGAGQAIVSAATCGFGCGNSLLRVDLSTGATTVLGSVAGPSGPVAVNAAGDLYYGTQSPFFPAPAGAFSVQRWSAAQVAAGALSDASAVAVITGLDGVADVSLDARSGDLIVVESLFGGLSRVRLHRADGALKSVLASSTDYLGGVGLRTSAGTAGALQPFAPAGSTYTYAASDFVTGVMRVQGIVPVQPQLSVSGPGASGAGSATLSVAGGIPFATAVLISAPASAWSSTNTITALPWFQLHSGLQLSAMRRSGIVQLDANGNGSLGVSNQGPGLPGRVWQALVRTNLDRPVGASTQVAW